ncbi:MAG TPA: chaperone ClpB [Ruminococcaceae bacterium]|nr:chaperone ClpB [Oscillospiraceae bacterium]
MMCSRCKKRPAVVFITSVQGENKRNEGLCLKCAKELNIPQVSEYINQLGIPEEMIEGDIDEFLDSDEFKSLFDSEEDDPESVDGFKSGGADTLMPFIHKLLGSPEKKSEESGKEIAENSQKEKKSVEHKEKTSEKNSKKRKFLDTFCTNLTAKAKRGELDRIVGREKEIYRVTQILSRRTKNNPCLIGEPGVGKTAIAEGIAQRLVSGEVPFRLKGKELYMLDLTALVAGTQFRGQFESRVKSLIDEVKSAGNILLFIDEVHNLVGTGDSEGTMNAANMFKPALSRGDLQVIGATTFDEYRKYIERDSALERRFQPVTVNEPSIEDTVQLLKGIKKYYEEHHAIHVSDEILRSCVILSERYITDRYLPDKAIDLLDESAACASIKSKDLAEYEDLKSDNKDLERELTDLSAEKENIDYERIAEIKTQISKNEIRINELEPLVTQIHISEEDVSKVIELWTGIPATKIMETEFKKISKLENILKSRVIGQDTACELVASAIKRTRVQLSARRRPASFIFVGPTGVGKTELVRVLANELFDTVDPLIRLDMSEYMEKYSVSKIIGSPPGYIGYDEAGQLTEKVRRKPYSVILFDEIEKAHPDVMNILLQILDEGKVTDSHGRTVSFENTVIAMTSNAGSSNNNFGGMGFGKTEGDISRERATNALKEFLRPEFLGRIDEIVVFNPLTEENYVKIAKLMLEEMKTALAEKKIDLKITEAAYKTIASKAYGGKYGGRDIRRVIRKELEDKVADLVIEKGEGGISEVNVSSKAGELVVS